MVSYRPDPKPARRTKASRSEWELLRAQKLGRCRVCEWGSGIELHHLVGKDLGGSDVADNLVPLCGSCHRKVEERKPLQCRILRDSLSESELAYILARKSEVFLDRYYPRKAKVVGL